MTSARPGAAAQHAGPPADAGAPVRGDEERASSAAQTLQRGLDVVEAVARAPGASLAQLCEALGLTRSTTHRLAAALVERRYLTLTPREGYGLGPKLLELGFVAQRQRTLVDVARPLLETLAQTSEDTVHLGVLEDGRAFYLDKVPGNRRIEISSRVGDRQPVASTGLGKALILDDASDWGDYYDREGDGRLPGSASREDWLARMGAYAKQGHAFDLEENEDRIRCVAAPIRGVGGRIVGAISVSSAAQYMDDARMAALADDVKACARSVGEELGWFGTPPSPPARRRPRSTPC